ncbi:MAG: hypothetical protein Q8L38_02130 [Pseudohongiella sp.]|nr:hypothetical protein [Pseudohongiella sp.]
MPIKHSRYVVDTNVLIAASAVDPGHSHDIGAEPEDPAQRLLVWQWLDKFAASDAHLVLDQQGRIFEEYHHKLGFDDYGLQVMLHKWDTGAVDMVDLAYDHDGNAVLPYEISCVVHDMADRKMVAAALAAQEIYGECCVAFAGDTDWYDWEKILLATGLGYDSIIDAWGRARYLDKQKRKPQQHHNKETNSK